jgi:hypothetical protein
VKAAGNMSVKGNLKVEGWLDAVNVKGPNKGLFTDVKSLREAFPMPHDGWWALVGYSLPAAIYVGQGGEWVATGGEGGLSTSIEGAINFGEGATFGTYDESLYSGSGAEIDADGNMEVESLRVRSAIEVPSLTVKRYGALEGDMLLTETDAIDSVESLGDGCYGLHLHEKWDGYFTAQAVNNVLRGIICSLDSEGGRFYTSWMRVNSVNAAANYIEVTLYADEETPAGRNYPPSEKMMVARYGNQTDEARQKCIYLSSTDGCIRKLVNVTKPITDSTNEGFKLGDPPSWLRGDIRIVTGRDYFYSMGVICQDLIQIDYNGQPIPVYVDCGEWKEGERYHFRSYDENNRYVISDVWHRGCKWRCQKDGTTAEPAWNNTDWAMKEGNPNFTVAFAEAEQIYDIDNFEMPLTVVATLYNTDVTDDILDCDVEWTRYSEDAEGNPRTASDDAWAAKHADCGKAIVITIDDLDAKTSSGFPKKVRFTATVTLRDGMGSEAATASVTKETN